MDTIEWQTNRFIAFDLDHPIELSLFMVDGTILKLIIRSNVMIGKRTCGSKRHHQNWLAVHIME